MAQKKKGPQKTAAKKALAGAKSPAVPGVTVTRSPNEVKISYDKPQEVLPHLLDLASDFADKHLARSTFTASEDDVLGTAAARDIVSQAAGSDCWSCTIGDLKLDSNIFQTDVFNGVIAKGYQIGRADIPASQSTQLYTVVMAIQDAPAAAAATEAALPARGTQ